MLSSKNFLNFICVLMISLFGLIGCSKKEEPKVEAPVPKDYSMEKGIAKDAYIYGFPIVDNYRILYSFFVNKEDSQYKGEWNTIINTDRVATPEDTAMQTPNSDTPYSHLGLDLRTEPIVITVPKMDAKRYWSIQFIDLYTHNFAYVGTRTTGNDGGHFMIVGPDWKGETPKGITKVIQSETQLGLGFFRTQLLNSADLPNVKKIQAAYKAQTLSKFLGEATTIPAPNPAPPIDYLKPISRDEQKTSPDFYNILNFVLKFCPTNSTETELMQNFAKIKVSADQKIDFAAMDSDLKKAYTDGMLDAWVSYEDFIKTKVNTGEVVSGQVFGTREHLQNNYMFRMTGAQMGIWGNSKDEAIYPVYKLDSNGKPLDASQNNYTIRFEKGQLPPANAFWSMTMYNLPESLLVANKLNRYLINSPMLPNLKKDPDGGITLYIQNDSPGAAKESNWLPAPNGPFAAFLRIYWPKPEALDGTWKRPELVATEIKKS